MGPAAAAMMITPYRLRRWLWHLVALIVGARAAAVRLWQSDAGVVGLGAAAATGRRAHVAQIPLSHPVLVAPQ